MAEINAANLDWLAAAWLRVPAFFRESRGIVQPDHFDRYNEGQYLVLWIVVRELYEQYNEINESLVRNAAQSMIMGGEFPISPAQAEDLLRPGETGLISSSYMMDVNMINLDYSRNVLKQFLHERAVLWPMRRIASGTPESSASLAAAIDRLSFQQRRIAAVSGLPTREHARPFGDVSATPASVFNATGIDWIDRQLTGQREGDVNAFLGFQGAGKSLFSTQLTVESARVSNALEGPDARLSTLFTYEEPLNKVEPRLMSAAMRIDRNKLDQLGNNWNQLTTRETMATYERNFGTCERERYEQNREWFNTLVRAFDMSGSDLFPTNGMGGVPEIVATLEQIQETTQRRVKTVVIDWAMPLVQRYMESRRVKEDFLRNHLADLGDQLRRQVANRFQCTVWITHQLKSDLNKTPTKLHDHTDAMECKSFCVHMPFAGVLSAPCKMTGVRRFHWSKHRAVADEMVPAILLKPDATIAAFNDVTNRYSCDMVTGSIVESRTAHAVLGVQ